MRDVVESGTALVVVRSARALARRMTKMGPRMKMIS